jgi:multiple sugar transport system substrate-binding protein
MPNHVSRRGVLALAGLGTLSVLAACSAASPAPTTAPAAPTQAAAPTAASAPATPQPTAQASSQSSGQKSLRFSSYSFGDFEAFATKNLFPAWDSSVNVQTEFVGGADYYTKVQTEIAAGSAPDIGMADYGHTVSYAKSSALLALDDLISRDKFAIDNLPKGGLDQYRWAPGDFNAGGQGGRLYALPIDAQPFIFVFNKNMFDQAGVAYPTSDWTWDDVVSAGTKITKADQNKWGIYIPSYGTLFRGNFIYGAGGDLISTDSKKSGLDSAPTAEALKWCWDLVYTHKIAPKPVPTEQVNPFASGRVAMWIDGVWTILDWSKITEFGWDMALLPKHPKTGKRTTSVESDGWWIFQAAKQQDLAWSLLKYLMLQSTQEKMAAAQYVIPPSNPDAAKTWYGQKPPDHRTIALENLSSDGRKVSTTYYESASIRTDTKVAIDKAWYDGQDILAQVKEAASIMNQDLDKDWKAFS